MSSDPKTTDVVALLRSGAEANMAMRDPPGDYVPVPRATYDALSAAATVIERLRANFIGEATEMGYDEEQAAEMLAQVEAGDDGE